MQYQSQQFLVLAVQAVWDVVAQCAGPVGTIIAIVLAVVQTRKTWVDTRCARLGVRKTELEILDLQRKLETADTRPLTSADEKPARNEDHLRPLLTRRDTWVFGFAFLYFLVALYWAPVGADVVVAVRRLLFYAVGIVGLLIMFALTIVLRVMCHDSTAFLESLAKGIHAICQTHGRLCEVVHELAQTFSLIVAKEDFGDECQHSDPKAENIHPADVNNGVNETGS